MTTLNKLRQERQDLRNTLMNGELPKVLNSGQLEEILPILSVEYLYASGILTSEGYSEQAMYGYVMCLQHVRELLVGVTQGLQQDDQDSNCSSNGGGDDVLQFQTEDT